MRPGLVLAQVMIVLSAVPATFAGQRPLSPSDQARLQQLGDRFLRQGKTERRQLLNQVSVAELAPWSITSTARVVQLQRLVGSRPIYYITDNLDAARTVGANRVWPSGDLGLALTGAGVTVALWDDGGVLTTHQEFAGRLTRRDTTLTTTGHATHTAGTIAAAGIAANAKGMAGGVQLDSYDWNDDTAEMASAAASGLVLSNHSFSLVAGWERDFFGDGFWAWHGDPAISGNEDWVFGFYLQVAADWDELAAAAPDYLMVTSAGNDRADTGPGPAEHWVYTGGEWGQVFGERDPDGDYDSLPGGASCAKNVLVVGAVGDIPGGYQQTADVVMSSLSSWGPTDDGRIKPDLVANGTILYSTDASHEMAYDTLSGTSTAAAVVTGSLALLLEHYRASLGGAQPRSATMRALVVHSANEAGNAAGPDYSFGWGLMNTAAAAELISLCTVDDRHVQELVLSDGGTVTLIVTSDGIAPVKVTMAWTDPPGTVPATVLDPTDPMLVNDLDLTLTSMVTQQLSSPWVLDQTNPEQPATTGDNYRDNIEQVWEPSPIAGEYQITIDHKGVLTNGSQQFSLVVTGAEFPPWPKVLVWEGDSTAADYSGRFIRDALLLGDSIDVDYRLVLPADLSVYDAAFLSFGNYGGGLGKTPFTDEQASVVQAYLEGRGRLYLEGGDALGVVGTDQGGNDTLWSLFGLDSVVDGYDYPVTDLVGQPSSLADSITFTSSDQSYNYIDRYTPGDGLPAFIESDYGTVAVQHSGENGRRSFVFSYTLAGLVDGAPPSTKSELLHRIYNFLMEEVPSPALTGISPSALWRGRRTQVQLTGQNLDIVTSITTDQPADVENPPVINAFGELSVYLTIREEATADSAIISANALTGSGSIAVRVDSAPETVDDTVDVWEDSTTVLALLQNDRHPPGDPLRIMGFSAALQGTVSVQPGDTTVSYSPVADYSGPDSFTYTAVDTGSESSQATVWLTILPVNDAPVLTSAQTDIAYHEERYVYRAMATDADGDSLLFSFSSQITWLEISDSDSAAGTPGAADSGGTLKVNVTDGEAWDSIMVVISVLPPNQPPVAMNDTVSTREDTLVIVAVINNDYDPDGDRLYISAATQGQHGEVAVQTGDTTIMYTPEADFNGMDQFIYTLMDAGGLTATAEVTVTVLPVNDPPGPFRLLSPATGVRIELRNGMLDDSLVFTWESTLDVEGDPVSYSFQATPALAGVVGTGSGADTSFSQLYSILAAALLETAERRLTGSWTVRASDGAASTDATDGPFVITLDATVLALELEVAMPSDYALEQNYPNPFNPVTTIPFALPEEAVVRMTINDIRGRELRRLIDARLPAGYHRVVWNGRDATGRPLPSGIYLTVMKAPKFVAQRKVVLLR